MLRAMRSTALALTLLLLAAGAVHAHPLAAHPAPAGFLGALWQWVTSYVPGWAKPDGTMAPNGSTKSGSSMDPDGAPPHSLLPPLPTSDSGGMMDPDG